MSTRLYLVRHGKAAASWDQDRNPGLDEIGRAQAEAMAATLGPRGPLPVIASPLRRTRETAAPLEAAWDATARIEPRVAEIRSPTDDLAERRTWLDQVMTSTWSEQPPTLHGWRQDVIDALVGLAQETVVVSHFVAINAAVGAAIGDDRVIGFRPDNCSVTVMEVADGVLRLVELGREIETEVL